MPGTRAKQRSERSALTIASRSPPSGTVDREDRARVGVEADPVDRAREAPPAAVAQRLPEALLGGGVEVPEPVEADLQARQAEPAHLALGGDHALDERGRGALA